MSFNVRDGEFDREEIVPQVVADYMPDSVGFQKCEGTWFMTLKAYLPDYTIVGVGRLTGVPLIGESTAIMYRNDKYKLVDCAVPSVCQKLRLLYQWAGMQSIRVPVHG